MAFLELKNIHKSYYLGKEEFPVLKGINLKFDLGDFVSILGESGGGKSTLMNIIGGLDREFTGDVLVDGHKLDHKKEKSLDSYRRETIGYIYQAYNLISHLTVLDIVLISLDMTELSKKEREQHAKSLLEKVGLKDQINKYPNQLSGGQKQRVAIARALASDPKVIIADEPTGALDAQNTQEVLDILNNIASEGRLVITVTHSQAVADAGTRIVHLADGKIDSDERIMSAYQFKPTTMIQSRTLPRISSIKTATKHFKYNFWRNSLIILGTSIGLFAVILFSGLGNGISGYITSQITKIANPQSVSVTRYVKSTDDSNGQVPPAAMAGGNSTSPEFTDKQINQISQLKHIDKTENSYTAANVSVKYGNTQANIQSLPNWTSASTNSSISIGHAPKEGEIIIDEATVAKKLSKNNWKDLIGKTVTVSYSALDKNNKMVDVTMNVKIAGIGKNSSGATAVSGINTETLMKALEKSGVSTQPRTLNLKIDHLDNVKDVTKKINRIKDNKTRLYTSSSIASMIDQVQTYVNLASILLAAIAGISLIVSALMIIVTMFMSVSARTKEIGILRALGESKQDIQWLFISESVIMGLLSAAFATVIAFVGAAIANTLLKNVADYSFIQISITNVVIAFALALIISLLASLLPARRAAKLNPIDALSAD